MTVSERVQPASVFIRAGQLACRMGINRMDNPYPKPAIGAKYASLWDQGYAEAMAQTRKFSPKPSSPRPYRGNKQLDDSRRSIGKRDMARDVVHHVR